MPNIDRNVMYLKIAKEISKQSYCTRKKVGAILVKNESIISDGYNGTPFKFDNVCEIDNVTKNEVLHAETNALAKIGRSTISSENSTLYVTLSPCFDCAKLIIQFKIKKVYYIEDYKDLSGIELLKKANIEVEKIDI